MDNIKDRLIFLWGRDVKPSQIAVDIGMSIPGFMRVWNENTIPRAEFLIKIKELKGCSIDWLLTGDGPSSGLEIQKGIETHQSPPVATDTLGNTVDLNDFVFIPKYDLCAAAGHGAAIGSEKPVFTMAFRKYWINNYLNASPKSLAVIKVKGDSMDGVLNDKDTILVDLEDNMPTNGLYVLRMNGDLIVKQVQSMPNNMIRVSSANPIYIAFEIDLGDLGEDVRVIGKVVWFGRQV